MAKTYTLHVSKPANDIYGEPLKGDNGTNLTIGDMLLGLMRQELKLEDKKEGTWLYELGLEIANAIKKKESISIPEKKFLTLKRLVENNKFYPPNCAQEVNFYFPFMLGQMLPFFEPSK